MGKLLQIAPTNAVMNKRMHAARKRLNCIEGLAFEVETALAKCCQVCPPSDAPRARRDLKILRERTISAR
jgi:hypothetical protein